MNQKQSILPMCRLENKNKTYKSLPLCAPPPTHTRCKWSSHVDEEAHCDSCLYYTSFNSELTMVEEAD